MKASLFILPCPRCGTMIQAVDMNETDVATTTCRTCRAKLKVRKHRDTEAYEVKEHRPS